MGARTSSNESVEIPSGITSNVNAGQVSISGPKGKNSRKILIKGMKMEQKGNKIEISGELRGVMTAKSHVLNMIRGSTEGYSQEMKVIYAHFPVSLELKGKEMWIKNFIGEKQPRKAKIVGDTKIEIKGQQVTVSGPSKEDVGQTVANLRQATKILKRDSRMFQDGIYPIYE